MAHRARVNGVELVYEIAGSGPRLTWMHGLASCVEGDRDLVEGFAEYFTVLAYDARGHDRSSPFTDPAAFSHRVLADDAMALFDEIGWGDSVLAGASMGAGTAARVAAMAPERARALVMTRPAARGPDGCAPPWLRFLFSGGAHALRTGGLDGAVAFLLSLPQVTGELTEHPERIQALRRDWGRHDIASIAAALDGVPGSSPTEGFDSGTIVCPTLIIPGDDIVHPTEAAVSVAALIPHAELVAPFIERARPDEIAHIVGVTRAFLARTGALAV